MLDEILAALAENHDAEIDLVEVALLMAQEEHPHLSLNDSLVQLDEIAEGARHLVQAVESLEDQVHALCDYLFFEMGYDGNRDDYYSPDNSYLNCVIERRLGIPITLTLFTMAVGTRLGLPIRGIALPGHFMAQAIDDDVGENIVFDPFNQGQMYTPTTLIESGLIPGLTAVDFDNLPVANAHTWVTRMYRNLQNIYAQRQDYRRLERVLRRLVQLLPEDESIRREYALAFVVQRRPGPAIAQLQAFLSDFPHAADADALGELLSRLRADLASRN